jgi:DNA-binding XRE family transcriptional regulator
MYKIYLIILPYKILVDYSPWTNCHIKGNNDLKRSEFYLSVEVIFGKVLRSLREEKNLSQEQLALLSELDRTYISLLERGKRRPTINTLFALSEPLNIKPSKIIEKVEQQRWNPKALENIEEN